jgi:hypothetical protein
VLDRTEGKMRFIRIHTHAKLRAASGTDWERAKRLLEKAEATCPISNSLNCQRELTVEVVEKLTSVLRPTSRESIPYVYVDPKGQGILTPRPSELVFTLMSEYPSKVLP